MKALRLALALVLAAVLAAGFEAWLRPDNALAVVSALSFCG
ncbi:hypothetical protein NX774_05175 [Massilia agilis]|uniref:Uncharacterized protein n=1 Tax=Massilia agilis TaxID=1811226 RepID=A0ABT2D7M2_9BURK|nr:hypothetical protein [Massilia agilis]MCS0807313.1 hypothetical protein [Massilia agilis]